MTEVATGNQDVTPAPAPANVDLEAKVASHRGQIKEAFEKAATGQAGPAATPEPKETQVDVPQFFARKAKEAAPPAFDPAKLSPELQEAYKSMQADFTQKWQSASDLRKQTEEMRSKLDDERRVMMDNQKALLDALKAGRPEQAPAGTDDPMTTIQTLRDEGRHAEADQLLARYLDNLAEQKVAPMKKEAELNLLKTTFRDTASEITMNNPVVNRYREDVTKVFDGDSPLMQTIRPYLFQSPQSIRTFVPLVLNAIATEIHARTLEENFDKAVDAKVNSTLEARRASAARVPAKLVESGSASRTSAPGKMSLSEAVALAQSGNSQ